MNPLVLSGPETRLIVRPPTPDERLQFGNGALAMIEVEGSSNKVTVSLGKYHMAQIADTLNIMLGLK